MAEFPVDPMLAKMIIQSEKFGVSGGWGLARVGAAAGRRKRRLQASTAGAAGASAAWPAGRVMFGLHCLFEAPCPTVDRPSISTPCPLQTTFASRQPLSYVQRRCAQ